MLDFAKTGIGRRFFDSTLPGIEQQLKRIADELHRANTLRAQEMARTPADVAKEFIEGDKGADERYGRKEDEAGNEYPVSNEG